MYVCSFYLFTANAHKAANANISCCFNGTRNKNCEHSQVNHTVFFQNEINKVANGTYFSDMKSKHTPLLILIVFLYLFRLCYHVHVEVWCPPQTWKFFGTTTWKKNICFCCLPVFMCIIRRSSRSNLSLLHHWCIICLWILGYVRLESIQNSCELLVHRQWSNTGDLLQFICLCIYMFFVVWIFIPFLCFKSKSGCITPEQQH